MSEDVTWDSDLDGKVRPRGCLKSGCPEGPVRVGLDDVHAGQMRSEGVGVPGRFSHV